MKKQYYILILLFILTSGIVIWSKTTQNINSNYQSTKHISEEATSEVGNNLNDFISENNDQYVYTQKYLEEENVIEFYKDNVLINTFDVDENNPFEIEKRQIYSYTYPNETNEHIFYGILNNDINKYKLNKGTEEISLLSRVATNFGDEESGIIAVSYILNGKPKGLHPETSLGYHTKILLLNRKGSLVKSQELPSRSFVVNSVSKDLHFFSGKNESIFSIVSDLNKDTLNTLELPRQSHLRNGYFLDNIFIGHLGGNVGNDISGAIVINLNKGTQEYTFCDHRNCSLERKKGNVYLYDNNLGQVKEKLLQK